jgi:zinc protease
MRYRTPVTALLATMLLAPVAGAQTAAAETTKKMTPPAPTSPRPFAFPKYAGKKLRNGLAVFVVEDRRLPLVSYSLQIQAGKLDVPPAKSGLATAAAALLREGTRSRSAQDIARAVDNAGASLNASAGDDFTSVTGTFMKTHAAAGLELLADIVRNPVFEQEEIDRFMEQQLSGLAVQYNDPEYILPLAAARVLYGTHPYAYPADGTPQSLETLSRDDLVDFHRRLYVPARAWLAIAGDVSAEEAFAAAEKAFGTWKGAPRKSAAPPAPPARKAHVVLIDKPDAVQSRIAVGHLGVPRQHPDYLTLQVANQIFGGSFNSRVNMKLRANEGLTYGAGSSFRAQRLAGSFTVSTFTRTDKTADAVRFIVDLIREWKENPATAAELAEAKAYLIGSYSVDLETAGAAAGRVLTQAVFNLPADYFPNFRERVQAITIEDVAAAVRKHIEPAQLTIAVAGNTAEFAGEMKKHGPVRTIPMNALDLLAPSMTRPQ